ncbi:MAG: hypothetical protein AB7N71_09510 [Phycisphaerae bacterium]
MLSTTRETIFQGQLHVTNKTTQVAYKAPAAARREHADSERFRSTLISLPEFSSKFAERVSRDLPQYHWVKSLLRGPQSIIPIEFGLITNEYGAHLDDELRALLQEILNKLDEDRTFCRNFEVLRRNGKADRTEKNAVALLSDAPPMKRIRLDLAILRLEDGGIYSWRIEARAKTVPGGGPLMCWFQDFADTGRGN